MGYEGEMFLLEQLLYDVGGESMDREDLKALADARMLFSGRVQEELGSGTQDGIHSGHKGRKPCLARPRRMGDLHKIRQRECTMKGGSGISRSGGRVVLVGNDGLGVRVLQDLCELGIKVTAVCASEQTPFARAARDARVSLIIGNPELEETLREAGIDEASACGLLVDSDLINLHVALELLELAPRARVVLRLFNISLAGAIHGLLGDVAVLSATELAAPAFVEAALRGSVGIELRAGDRQVAVQEVDGGDPNLWLALAEAESEEGEPRIFPVEAARVVGIVDRGPAEVKGQDPVSSGGLDTLAASQNEGFLTMATRLSRTWWVLIQGTFGILDRRLAIVGVMFALLIVTSTLMFNRYLGLSLLDAVYFVVVTVATVGYGDINLLEASPPSRCSV
jgi:voltage-gated potassium channel Kch